MWGLCRGVSRQREAEFRYFVSEEGGKAVSKWLAEVQEGRGVIGRKTARTY